MEERRHIDVVGLLANLKEPVVIPTLLFSFILSLQVQFCICKYLVNKIVNIVNIWSLLPRLYLVSTYTFGDDHKVRNFANVVLERVHFSKSRFSTRTSIEFQMSIQYACSFSNVDPVRV